MFPALKTRLGVPVLFVAALGAVPLQERPADRVPGLNLPTGVAEPAAAKPRRIFFELRLAENEPVRGLTVEAQIKGSKRKIHVHYRTLVTNTDLLKTTVAESGGRVSLVLTLDPEAGAEIGDATSRHRGRPVVIVLDGEVVAAWTLQTALSNPIVVPVDFTSEEAARVSAGLVW